MRINLTRLQVIISRFITAYLSILIINLFKYEEPLKIAGTNFPKLLPFFLLVLIIFAGLSLIENVLNRHIANYLALALIIIYSLLVAAMGKSVYTGLGILAIDILFFIYYKDTLVSIRRKLDRLDRRVYIVTGFIFLLAIAGLVTVLGVLRYELCSSATFDMGIFTQMFYNLNEHLSAVTTLERDEAISHFSVHTSIFYFLLLPIYKIFPYNETLLILQGLSVIAGGIVFFFLMKTLGYKRKGLLAFMLIYILSPAVFGGCFYDFHENVFLLPLILGMFLAYEKECTVVPFVMAFLVCTVKEDATLFVLVFGLFLLINRLDIKKGIGMLLLGGGYMAAAFTYLSIKGDGLMTNHYSSLVNSTYEGLLSILSTLTTNPGYLLTLLITEKKIEFIFAVFMPVTILPFYTKKFSRFILLIPFVFINLLPSYSYQHSVFFQYVFGSYCFILYLSALNARDLTAKQHKNLQMSICVISAFICCLSHLCQKTYYIENYKINQDIIAGLDEDFASIPENASVIASTFFVPKLSQRDEIYTIEPDDIENEIDYSDMAEYAVFDMRPGYCNEDIDAEIAFYVSLGYVPYKEDINACLIYVNPNYGE